MKSIKSIVSLRSLSPLCGLLLLATAATGAEEKATATAAKAAPPTVAVKDLLAGATNYDGKEIVLEGMVTDYCKNKGCWALVHDTDPDAKGQVRVKQDDDAKGFKAFLPEIQGRTVLVTGEFHDTHIDKDYLDKWEARVKTAKEKAKGKDTEASYDKVLKQIAGYREQVGKSKEGYLHSYGLAVAKWEAKP
jgi:hypothetical protein